MSQEPPAPGMDDYLLPDTGSDKMRTGMVVILIINLSVCFGLIAAVGGFFLYARMASMRSQAEPVASEATHIPATDSATARPTATISPTAPPATQMALEVGPPAGWVPVAYDDFTVESDQWQTGPSGEAGAAQRSFQYEVFVWRLDGSHGGALYDSPRSLQAYNRFYASVEARHTAGSGGSYGLVFREVADQYYVAQINTDGTFAVYAHRSSGDWETLVPPTGVPLNGAGRIDKLAVRGEWNQFAVYINDQHVAGFSHDRHRVGRVGLFAAALPDMPLRVEFDNFHVYVPADVAQTDDAAATLLDVMRFADVFPSEDFDSEPPAEWELALEESFGGAPPDWTTYPTTDTTHTSSTRIEDALLVWENTSWTPGAWQIGPHYAGVLRDFQVSVMAQQAHDSAADLSAYGLAFRRYGLSFYAFLLNGEGEATVILEDANTGIETVLPWTPVRAFDPERPNEITVRAVDTHFVFFVNGQYVGEMEESAPTEGRVGVAIAAFEENIWMRATFDDFRVYAPPE